MSRDGTGAHRSAVVTGASSGIGEATARRFAAAGYAVVLGARRVERCEALAEAMRADGGEAHAVHLDLADAEATEAFAAAVAKEVGTADVVVSNAGDALPGGALDTEPDRFARQLDVNLTGAHRLVSLLVPPMVERGSGDLVFVSSDVLVNVRPWMASYVAAKWGLEGLARCMQLELEGTGVRASIVRPGPTLTGMGDAWDMNVIGPLLERWKTYGFQRHDGYLSSEAVAGAIEAVVATPRGTHLTLVEVEPEAPVRSNDG